MYLFKIAFFLFLSCTPSSGVVGSQQFYFFTFRTLNTLFHSSCTNLHSHQQWAKVPFSPYAGQSFPVVELFMRALRQVPHHSSLQIWFAFLWWLEVLSIFLCGHVHFLFMKKSIQIFCLLKKIFICLFIFDCAGSWWLPRLFSSCGEWGLLSSRGHRFSSRWLPCCRAQALSARVSVSAVPGP